MDDTNWVDGFKSEIILRNSENLDRIKVCFSQLNEKQLWHKPNSQTNSVANLVLHLRGNITQYIHSSIGNEPDNRQRDLEFSTQSGISKVELLEKITECVTKANRIIEQTDKQRLLNREKVQGFEMAGMGNLIHVAEHLSYHTGQIALLTKLMTEKDLGFYAGIDLNIPNSSTK
ncbi:MAG: hypothetical protein CL840_11780 [Crocinitomicaceae bacterium]|nr:hypothetical protein [Crocinitomicaceae bacterium]|tara:strand:- start:7570 stop:8091 length:522 start_codon:yes stop_codon:yes gene_type:complete